MKKLLTIVFMASMCVAAVNALSPQLLKEQAAALQKSIQLVEANIDDTADSRATQLLALDVLRAKLTEIQQLINNLTLGDTSGIESLLIALESKIDVLGPCSPEPITEDGTAQAPIMITGSVTIDSPGHYCLANDLEIDGSSNGILINDTNDVFLDLNNKRIINDPSVVGVTGINVNSSDNVTIANGTICSTSTGIFLNECNDFLVENVRIIGESTTAFAGNVGILPSLCVDGVIDNCSIYQCTRGVSFDLSDNVIIQNCFIGDVRAYAGSTEARGIFARDSNAIVVQDCVIDGLTALEPTPSSTVEGIGCGPYAQIINCIVNNITVPASGFARAYGIFTGTFSSISALAGAVIARPVRVSSVDWQPNSRYIAVATLTSAGGTELTVYEFTDAQGFIALSGSDIELATTINSVAWSPDGRFLAVGSNLTSEQIKIYSFAQETLTLEATVNGGANVNSVAWSADGNYLAVGANAGGTVDEIQIYGFGGTSLSLVTQVSDTDNILSVDWSPDGQYLATGSATSATQELVLYQFNGSTLTPVGGGSAELNAAVVSVAWSPHGDFLAIGTQSTVSPHVYPVVNGVLGTRIDPTTTGNAIRQVAWTPGGRTLAAAGSVDGTIMYIVSWSGSAFSLVQFDAEPVASEPFSVAWTTEGAVLATGGGSVTGYVNGYSGNFSGGPNTLVKNCTVSGISGGLGTAIGISSNPTSNLVIDNVAYNNDVNYAGVTNVYTGGYWGTPTLIQNIGVPPL